MTEMKVAAVGVHVLDTHVIGIESIPDGSDGQLVETIRMSPAGTAGDLTSSRSRFSTCWRLPPTPSRSSRRTASTGPASPMPWP